MRLVSKYSHFNAEEYLLVHNPNLWKEVREVIAEVDVASCKNMITKEKKTLRKTLYSPTDMSKAFKKGFEARGWQEHRNTFWVADDEKLLRSIYTHTPRRQKEAIEKAGLKPIMSYNQTDFLKDRVAVEIQFGKYPFVAHDVFVKHLSFYVSDVIDVGIEILPMKKLEMSSEVPYYERDLLNIIRHGRGAPAVPLVLVGVAP